MAQYKMPGTVSLPITVGAAGALGLAYAVAQLGVGLTRAKTGKVHGIEEGSDLYFRNRGANTIGEYAPIGLILLGLLEVNKAGTPKKLETLATLFVGFRVAHAAQLSFPKNIPTGVRAISFYSTIALLGVASVSLLVAGKKK